MAARDDTTEPTRDKPLRMTVTLAEFVEAQREESRKAGAESAAETWRTAAWRLNHVAVDLKATLREIAAMERETRHRGEIAAADQLVVALAILTPRVFAAVDLVHQWTEAEKEAKAEAASTGEEVEETADGV